MAFSRQNVVTYLSSFCESLIPPQTIGKSVKYNFSSSTQCNLIDMTKNGSIIAFRYSSNIFMHYCYLIYVELNKN